MQSFPKINHLFPKQSIYPFPIERIRHKLDVNILQDPKEYHYYFVNISLQSWSQYLHMQRCLYSIYNWKILYNFPKNLYDDPISIRIFHICCNDAFLEATKNLSFKFLSNFNTLNFWQWEQNRILSFFKTRSNANCWRCSIGTSPFFILILFNSPSSWFEESFFVRIVKIKNPTQIPSVWPFSRYFSNAAFSTVKSFPNFSSTSLFQTYHLITIFNLVHFTWGT